MDSERPGNRLTHLRFIPVILISAFAASPGFLITSQYVYDYYSRNNGSNPVDESFSKLDHCENVSETNNATKDASQFLMYQSIALTVPALLTMPVLGAMSDLFGRKIPLLLALLGNIIQMSLTILSIVTNSSLWVIIIGTFIHGCLGFHTGTISYVTSAFIADNCPPERVTFEMVLVGFWIMLGMTTGSLLTGYIFKELDDSGSILGYTLPLIISCTFEIAVMIYIQIYIPKFGHLRRFHTDIIEESQSAFTIFKTTVKSIIQKGYTVIIQTARYKTELLMVIILVVIYGFASSGSMDYFSVYVMSKPLCWRAPELSIFTAVQLVLHGLASVGISLLWTKKEWQNHYLLLIATVSIMIQFIFFGVASKSYMMYMGLLSGSFSSLMLATGRTMASSYIEPSNQGSLMSGITVIENCCRLLGIVVFFYIFKSTKDIFHGIIFFTAASFFLLCLPAIWKLHLLREMKTRTGSSLISDQIEEI